MADIEQVSQVIDLIAMSMCKPRFGRLFAYPAEVGDAIRAAMKDTAIRAHILREAWPAIPTEAMLNAVAPFPEHLRAEHPDPNDPWHNAMQGATLADQAYLQQVYCKMRDVALLPPPPTGGEHDRD